MAYGQGELGWPKSALNPHWFILPPFEGGGPSVSLTLCCFMVYSTRLFVLCLTLYYFVLVFFAVLLALRLPRLGKRKLILVLFVRLFGLRLLVLSVSSSSWCLGRAAVCDCDSSWTFL